MSTNDDAPDVNGCYYEILGVNDDARYICMYEFNFASQLILCLYLCLGLISTVIMK